MALIDAAAITGGVMRIGISVSTPYEAMAAEKNGADYIGLGPIFATSSKHDALPAVGLAAIREIRTLVDIPIVAIGGLTKDNIPHVIAAGADGIAVISAVVSQKDVRQAAKDLKKIIDDAVKASEDRR
jgi:thiamine-phosphate diphosphorylase